MDANGRLRSKVLVAAVGSWSNDRGKNDAAVKRSEIFYGGESDTAGRLS